MSEVTCWARNAMLSITESNARFKKVRESEALRFALSHLAELLDGLSSANTVTSCPFSIDCLTSSAPINLFPPKISKRIGFYGAACLPELPGPFRRRLRERGTRAELTSEFTLAHRKGTSKAQTVASRRVYFLLDWSRTSVFAHVLCSLESDAIVAERS